MSTLIRLPGLPYAITRDPMPEENDIPSPAADRLMAELYERLSSGRISSAKPFERAAHDYPEMPVFLNYLASAYMLLDKLTRAEHVIRQTIQKHPDYFFGYTSMAELAMQRNRPEEMRKWLGEDLKLETLFPNRQVFHLTEARAYHNLAGNYFIMTGDLDAARDRHLLLKQIDPDDPAAVALGVKIAQAELAHRMTDLQEEQKWERIVKSFPRVHYEATVAPPAFNHPETEELYRYGGDLPVEIIDRLLALPRATLLRDLELALEDAMRRYDYFREEYEEWSEKDQSFPMHALFFLSGLRAEESLPVILNILRQGEERLEFWFSDWLNENMAVILYLTGRHRLDDLRAFVLEPHLYAYSRASVAEAVAQVALHHPERRTEVVDWFRTVLQYHLDRPGDDALIDTKFIGLAAWDILDFKGRELTGDIKTAFDRHWIAPSLIGDWEEIEQDLEEPLDPMEVSPIPESVYEWYDGSYMERRARPALSPEQLEMNRKKAIDPAWEDLLHIMGAGASKRKVKDEEEDEEKYWPSPASRETVRRSVPKVGRNDPCPCGSGKKYKHCCGKK